MSTVTRAAHPGGQWDLGDPGSVYIRDASLTLSLPAGEGEVSLTCSMEVGARAESLAGPFELYQDSSGGENWNSPNHVNHNHTVPVSFRGYRLRAGGTGIITALARIPAAVEGRLGTRVVPG